jgi:dihydrofolate synthase/folylpolyglutamate synthase
VLPEGDRADDAAYHEALDRLFARTTGAWKLGLERVSTFFDRVGNPHRAYPVFHLAGTNGKGSTVATLSALLRGAGLRVGKYTSPHLVDFRERIIVDDKAIPRATVTDWLQHWEAESVELGATFFETTTVMALDYFASQDIDVAVVEVGLGGRLDATNVVQPVATAVTQIGYDHMEFLGETLHQIAFEKAGIFKRGVPAVVGAVDPSIRDQLVARAHAVGASPIVAAGTDWQVRDVRVDGGGTSFTLDSGDQQTQLHTPLIGEFQADNTATALAMLRAAGGRWAEIAVTQTSHLDDVRLPGRFHRSGRYLFDVAHNPDGARALAANVRHMSLPAPVSALVTVLRDKDWKGILRALAEVSDTIVATTAPTAPAARAWHLDEVAEWSASEGVRTILEPDFDAALDLATRSGETVLVTGSFHTVGDAMARLQVDPLAR